MTGYLTVAEECSREFTEKRSRFIGQVKPVQTEEEAQAFIMQIRKKHWQAKHTVYAYVLREGGIIRSTDDGEPQGSAGVPVLAVLQKKGLCNVVVVVTRYFGGVLLGAGGLVRAYGHAASIAVEGAGILHMDQCCVMDILCSYSLLKGVQETIQSCGGMVEHIDYGEEVCLRFYLQKKNVEPLQEKLIEISCGRLSANLLGEEYRPVRQEEN
jgi:uncharacterized YigZ family protein